MYVISVMVILVSTGVKQGWPISDQEMVSSREIGLEVASSGDLCISSGVRQLCLLLQTKLHNILLTYG